MTSVHVSAYIRIKYDRTYCRKLKNAFCRKEKIPRFFTFFFFTFAWSTIYRPAIDFISNLSKATNTRTDHDGTTSPPGVCHHPITTTKDAYIYMFIIIIISVISMRIRRRTMTDDICTCDRHVNTHRAQLCSVVGNDTGALDVAGGQV